MARLSRNVAHLGCPRLAVRACALIARFVGVEWWCQAAWWCAPRCELLASRSLGVVGAGRCSVAASRSHPRPMALLYLCAVRLGHCPVRYAANVRLCPPGSAARWHGSGPAPALWMRAPGVESFMVILPVKLPVKLPGQRQDPLIQHRRMRSHPATCSSSEKVSLGRLRHSAGIGSVLHAFRR
jgi:hypothetical protein